MGAFVPALISGISGLAGGLLNRPQEQKSSTNQTQNTNQTQSSSQNASSLPVYDPYQLQMRNYLLSQFYNRSNPSYINELVSSSMNNGTNAINASAAPQQQALQNALASRGLSYSGSAGTAIANQQAQRIGQITNLQAQAPLLRDSIQGNNLTSFSDFLSRLPVGTQSSGTSTGSSQGTTTGSSQTIGQSPGNILGGAVEGAGTALASLYGLGAFKSPNKPGNQNTSGGGGGIN